MVNSLKNALSELRILLAKKLACIDFFTFEAFSQEAVFCALACFACLTLSDKARLFLKSILRLADKNVHLVNTLFKIVIILIIPGWKSKAII